MAQWEMGFRWQFGTNFRGIGRRKTSGTAVADRGIRKTRANVMGKVLGNKVTLTIEWPGALKFGHFDLKRVTDKNQQDWLEGTTLGVVSGRKRNVVFEKIP